MKEFWVKVFSDKNGVPSSTRVLSAIVILDVLGVWTGLCFVKNEFLPLGYDNLVLIVSCLGLKIYNRKWEVACDGNKVVSD